MAHRKPSALVDTRVIYCGDNLEQLPKLPDACIDLIYIDRDMGIDGRIYPVSAAPKKLGKETGHLDFMDVWYPVQVKQWDKAGRRTSTRLWPSAGSSTASRRWRSRKSRWKGRLQAYG